MKLRLPLLPLQYWGYPACAAFVLASSETARPGCALVRLYRKRGWRLPLRTGGWHASRHLVSSAPDTRCCYRGCDA
ncbi:hypothetical protein BC831DRAFT_446253 [Entophlyctis helioformis]|nr:hypothetical protein BC831DRAFT_446253 [Entophlyctis helioformis]